VSAPTVDKPINRLPEISVNYEVGLRGELVKQLINLQLTYFNNNIKNYYSAGRNEAFQSLGAVNINGLESSVNLNLHKFLKSQKHNIILNFSGTLMRAKVLSGLLKDSDLLKANHTDATKEELITKINSEREGYDVYFSGLAGKDSMVTRELTISDFAKIKRLDLSFGESDIANNTLPYLPNYILNTGFTYIYKGFSFGANVNYVAKQYTDYLNFENETSEGAIGSLNSFKTIFPFISFG
jgi:Fe(3+) dicitrate transport protein